MLWVWFVVQRTGMGSKVSGLRMKTMAECHAASLDWRGACRKGILFIHRKKFCSVLQSVSRGKSSSYAKKKKRKMSDLAWEKHLSSWLPRVTFRSR